MKIVAVMNTIKNKFMSVMTVCARVCVCAVACSVQWNARHCMKCSVSPRVAIAAAAAAATVAASDHFSWL